MSDIPDALVERFQRAVYEHTDHWMTDVEVGRVLAAVWPDLAEEKRRAIESALIFAAAHDDEPARPVVDRDALADVIYRSYHDPANAFDTIPEALAADAILASGVVQDAADVRRAVARRVEAFCDLREQQGHEYVRVDDVRAMVTEVGGRHE